MENHSKTREELLKALEDLRLENESIKSLYQQDISAGKRAESRLQKLNRIYAVLSEVNHTIVQTRVIQELFEAACRIAVEQGKLRMAWIGLLDYQTKLVNPVAHEGVVGDYLEKLKIRLGDSQRGQGPTSIAMRTGIHYISNDIENNPIMSPWRDDALRMGFRSSAAFPIIVAGSVGGTFNLYAAEPDFFDENEVKLLVEMVANIAFAMEFIEQENHRKEAEKKLLEQKNLLNTIIESASEAIFAKDSSGKYCSINETGAQMLGFRAADVIGRTDMELLSGETANEFRRTDEIVMQSGQGYIRDEIGFVLGKPRVFLAHKTVWRDDSGKVIGVIGVSTDITERKRVEKELIKLSQAVLQSPASVVITDLDGNIEYANPKTLETTGYLPEELLGKNPRVLSSGEMSKEEYKIVWETISSGKEWRGEFHNKKKNGELYWESSSISPIIDDNGKIIHYLAVKEEITEKKQILDELIRAKEQAELSNKLKDAFISNISHEIRTPLNGILGMSDIIRESFSQYITKEEEPYFSSIQRSSKRLISTVDKILNFSRLQAGDFPVTKSNVSITSTLEILIRQFNPFAAAKSIIIHFNSGVEDDTVFADAAGLHNAFENIIENAVKFTESGSVFITLYRDVRNKLSVDVRDTGTGIAEEYLPNLFKSYSQEEIGFSRPYEGLGLGLAISKILFDINGASISVKSKKGEGTVFTICFDKQYTNQNNNKPVIPEETKVQHDIFTKISVNKRPAVLVVEDDKENQLFFMAILKKDFDVEMAFDAAKAFKLLKSRSFDLILMDISLKPGINGLELTKVIRNENSNIPIIAVTGYAFSEDRGKAQDAGCNEFLAKPFNRSQLMEKIRLVVG